MIKIKCCFIACKHNAKNIDLGNNLGASELGECLFDGEIILEPYACESCGYEENEMTCANFAFS